MVVTFATMKKKDRGTRQKHAPTFDHPAKPSVSQLRESNSYREADQQICLYGRFPIAVRRHAGQGSQSGNPGQVRHGVIVRPLLPELVRGDDRNYDVEDGECEPHDQPGTSIGPFRLAKPMAWPTTTCPEESKNGS